MVLHGLCFRPQPDLAPRVEALARDTTELGKVAADVGATRAVAVHHAGETLILFQFPPDGVPEWVTMFEKDRFRTLLRLVAPAIEEGFDPEDVGSFVKWADANTVKVLADVYASKGSMVDV